MHNWSVDTSRLLQNPKAYKKFSLEQRINFGLDGEKLSLQELRDFWLEIEIDPRKRAFLEKIVWKS